MDVISNPEVFQALKQDKVQNLQFLKEHHGVRFARNFFIEPGLTHS
jgi:hypothetical protein